MFVVNSQRQEFESWMDNAAIKEPEKTNFYNWIIKSPVDIFIPKIPPVECSIGSNQRGFVFDILVHINGIDWLNYCLLYTSPSPRDWTISRMPSSA